MSTPVWYGLDSQSNKNSEAVVPICRVYLTRELLAQLGLLLNLLSLSSSVNRRDKEVSHPCPCLQTRSGAATKMEPVAEVRRSVSL